MVGAAATLSGVTVSFIFYTVVFVSERPPFFPK